MIDPWSNEIVQEKYLYEEFGMQKISPQIKQRFSSSHLFYRDIIVGHRDFDKFLEAYDKKQKIAIMSGIKPSNHFHLGSKQTADEIIFFQKYFKTKVYYCIADIESYIDNKLPIEQATEYAISNVADLLALGLDEKETYFYRQSTEPTVLQNAFLVAEKLTHSTLKATYGEKDIGYYMCSFIQIADIFLAQSKKFGGPKHVLVPVGLDQDPHIRLARDLAPKFKLIEPAATYHRFIKNLKGEQKMSKKDPQNIIYLSENPKDIEKKLKNAITGGRNTAQEQRLLGGEIEKCYIFELAKLYFELNDEELKERYEKCTKGKILCGECKGQVIKKALEWFEKHQHLREKKYSLAQKIVEKIS
ncbi:MAG: tryptophan--tRNA ligase [Candidatus Micrarchaeota archaeon]|nr:tryptophan--tRNA ligase [Candidatus Micrarchaeota archaeon]